MREGLTESGVKVRAPKIFIVSLLRASERRKFMESQLRRLKLEFEFVEAFDALTLSTEDLDKVNNNRVYGAVLKKGEIACAISHARACDTLASDPNCEYGLVIEDDVILGRKLGLVLSQLQTLGNKSDVILLYSPIYRPVALKVERELTQQYSLTSPNGFENVFGTQAYFLSKEKAKQLSQAITPVKTIADDWQRYFDLGVFQSIKMVFPFPVLHAEFISVVNEKGQTRTLGLRSRFKNFFYRNRLFPFYHLFLVARRRAAEARQKKNISVLSPLKHSKTYWLQ